MEFFFGWLFPNFNQFACISLYNLGTFSSIVYISGSSHRFLISYWLSGLLFCRALDLDAQDRYMHLFDEESYYHTRVSWADSYIKLFTTLYLWYMVWCRHSRMATNNISPLQTLANRSSSELLILVGLVVIFLPGLLQYKSHKYDRKLIGSLQCGYDIFIYHMWITSFDFGKVYWWFCVQIASIFKVLHGMALKQLRNKVSCQLLAMGWYYCVIFLLGALVVPVLGIFSS